MFNAMFHDPEKFSDPNGEPSKTWFSSMFRSLTEGGAWGVKRCGVILTKRGDKMIVTARMPHMKEMLDLDPPVTAEKLKEQQDWEIARITEHFAAVGVTVEDQSK